MKKTEKQENQEKQLITFDDILGNISELEKEIVKAYTLPPTSDFYVNLTREGNEIAKLAIVVNVVVANIVIFRDSDSCQNFFIEWTSHPINKLVNTWLKSIDTQKERARLRYEQIKQELLETTWSPTCQLINNIDGI